jgi:hypothetical protein
MCQANIGINIDMGPQPAILGERFLGNFPCLQVSAKVAFRGRFQEMLDLIDLLP